MTELEQLLARALGENVTYMSLEKVGSTVRCGAWHGIRRIYYTGCDPDAGVAIVQALRSALADAEFVSVKAPDDHLPIDADADLLLDLDDEELLV